MGNGDVSVLQTAEPTAAEPLADDEEEVVTVLSVDDEDDLEN